MPEIRPPAAPPAAAAATPRAGAADTPEARRRMAQQFEGQVLGAMLQPMFQGLSSKGPFTGGAGEAQWRPMLVQEIGNAIARNGGLGLAAAIERDLSRGGR
ncbi:rod-binding protein [Falsiroseomonas sp. CW058]|uniref:rod-binding protein n=1 Tax=Falsiroseomonas sp. CW058 TaxID=3388664 RepID=UPI003D32170B